MTKKGQATSLSQILIGLLTIGIIAGLIFFFMTRGQEIQVKVEENEILRRRIILTNVLISSEKLAYDDGSVYRGILDKNKLDEVQKSPDTLFAEISYPRGDYNIRVVDLDEPSNKWEIGKILKAQLEMPVAIRYSENDVHIGLLSISFRDCYQECQRDEARCKSKTGLDQAKCILGVKLEEASCYNGCKLTGASEYLGCLLSCTAETVLGNTCTCKDPYDGSSPSLGSGGGGSRFG